MTDLNNATLQWLNDLTAQGILTTDTNLRIQGWNRWLELHSGRRSADMIGRNLLEVYPELVSRHHDQWYRQALNGQVMVLAQRLHRYLLPMPPSIEQSGFEYMQQSARIAPLTALGQIVGTITVIEDVTERELRENELRRQIAALEALHDVGLAILSLDLEECLQRLVDTTALLVHTPFVAVVLRHDEHLRIEASTADIGHILEERLNSPRGVATTVIRSGQPLFIPDLASKQTVIALEPASQCVIATPLIVESTVIGALVIEAPDTYVFDQSDQKQVSMLATQAAIGIRNAQLYHQSQEAIQMREAFLSIAAHELKTPLTSMLGYTQVLQRRVAREQSLNDRDTRTLQVIATQAARLNRMVAALFDLSRIHTGQLSIQRAPLDLCMLAQRVVEEIQPTIEQHTLTLNLPDEPVLIEGDEIRLEQVLQNLIQNAFKYSPHGGEVHVQIKQHDNEGYILVKDEGIGIPTDALPQLFGRFYRAHNAQTRHISGMGVGLYVVKEIITLHGGQITVASEEGAGSTFTIRLPLYE